MMDQVLPVRRLSNMKKGFTLIELLIVIGIIGILAAIAMFGIANVFPRTRDTERKSDIKQIQALVERYANQNNNLYPPNYGAVCTAAASCPTDPIDTGVPVPYDYYVNATGTEYALAAEVEISTSPCDGGGMSCFWMICSDGKAGYTSLVPTMPYSGCPLP